MKKIDRKRLLVIGIYLLHLFIYGVIAYATSLNIETWTRVAEKIEIDFGAYDYKNLYLSIYFIILTTYSLVKTLNPHMNKYIKIFVYAIGLIFAILSFYKYYEIVEYVKLFIFTNVLILSINLIYKKLNDYKNSTIS